MNNTPNTKIWRLTTTEEITQWLQQPRTNSLIPYGVAIAYLAQPTYRKELYTPKKYNIITAIALTIAILSILLITLLHSLLTFTGLFTAIILLLIAQIPSKIEKDYNQNVAIHLSNYILRDALTDKNPEELLSKAVEAIQQWQIKHSKL